VLSCRQLCLPGSSKPGPVEYLTGLAQPMLGLLIAERAA
jgi:hypothetical protein